MKAITIYGAYFIQFLKSRMVYRGDFFASIFANMIVTSVGLLFIVLLIDGKVVPSLHGWNRQEVLFIYGYSMISMAFFSTIATNLYQFGDRYVIQGEFDRVLLRPLNSLSQVLFESFNLEAVGSLIVGIIVISISSNYLEISLSLLDLAWLLFSAISGAIILLSVFVFLATLSFFFEDRIGVAPPVYSLIAFGRYPVTIYNETVQFILRWVVPFAFVAFYPATYFFNRPGFEFYCYFTPIMALICATVAASFWKLGVKHYGSTGN